VNSEGRRTSFCYSSSSLVVYSRREGAPADVAGHVISFVYMRPGPELCGYC